MALNHQLAAEICRQRLGIPDASHNAAYILLIPQALNALARKVATNEHRRHLLLTDPATVTVTLDGTGAVDLSAVIAAQRLIIELLHYGQIRSTASAYPLQPVTAAQGAFVGVSSVADDYISYYLEGTKLRTINLRSAGAVLSGNLTLAVPYVPNLAALPAQLEEDFLAKLVEVAQATPNDSAEDGPK